MQKTTKEVVERFNFKGLRTQMVAKKMRWNFNGEFRVPTQAELRARAIELVDRALTQGYTGLRYGGTFNVNHTGDKITLQCEERIKVRSVTRPVRKKSEKKRRWKRWKQD